MVENLRCLSQLIFLLAPALVFMHRKAHASASPYCNDSILLPIFLFQSVFLAAKVRRTNLLEHQSHLLMQFLLKVQVYLLRTTLMILIREEHLVVSILNT